MQSVLPKVLHQVSGRSMLGHVLAVADALGAVRTVVVCAANTVAQITAAFGSRYEYIVQHERLGTGHAVMAAHELLAVAPGNVLVLYADSPLIQVATAQALVEGMRQSSALVGLLSFHAEPLVRATELLLQERLPVTVSTTEPLAWATFAPSPAPSVGPGPTRPRTARSTRRRSRATSWRTRCTTASSGPAGPAASGRAGHCSASARASGPSRSRPFSAWEVDPARARRPRPR